MAKKKSETSTKDAPKQSGKAVKLDRVEKKDIDINEMVSQGWIHIVSLIEVMGITKDIADKSLKDHLARIESENGIIVTKKKFSTIEKVEKPPRNIKEAYSQFVEVEFLVKNYSMLIYYVFTYGPSSVEILNPVSITLRQGEAQDIANALASLIHQFASNAGGIVVSQKKQSSL